MQRPGVNNTSSNPKNLMERFFSRRVNQSSIAEANPRFHEYPYVITSPNKKFDDQVKYSPRYDIDHYGKASVRKNANKNRA